MVEGVEKLRLQQETDPLRDRDMLGQRNVVVGLMRSIHVENLTECARRGVGSEIGGVGTDSRRNVGRVDGVHIARVAHGVHTHGTLQLRTGDSSEIHTAVGIVIIRLIAAEDHSGARRSGR